jgi:hypothetical protein
MLIDGFSYEVIKELNFLRSQPKEYIKILENDLKYFTGNILKYPGETAGLQTKEGKSAYIEAIKFLQNAKPVPQIKPHAALFYICNEYVNEVKKYDIHSYSKVNFEKYLTKYGNFTGKFSKITDFGGNTPRRVITNFLVCDGDIKRGYRLSLLSREFKLIGASSAPFPVYNRITVLVNCTKFTSFNPSYDQPLIINEVKSIPQNKPVSNENKNILKSKKPQNFNNNNLAYNKNQINNVQNNNNIKKNFVGVNKNNNDLDANVKSLKVTEKIEVINGIKYKVIKKVKVLDNGETETETITEKI